MKGCCQKQKEEVCSEATWLSVVSGSDFRWREQWWFKVEVRNTMTLMVYKGRAFAEGTRRKLRILFMRNFHCL